MVENDKLEELDKYALMKLDEVITTSPPPATEVRSEDWNQPLY